jgi:RNA polymerase sigma factor (sigma-70 family)
MLPDAVIARRAAGGNQRAFAAIFERYHQDLYRYCAAILGNAEDAQDAVQNTMLKVLRALPGEGRELKLKPWLYRIAHNEAIDLIRARRSTEPVDAEALAAIDGPAETVEARGRLRQLISDIAELPDRQRGALVMREMGGLGYEQIGEALRTSPAVARQTIYEARLSLRQMKEGREMPCREVMRAISDDDGRILRRRDIRAHLHDCEDCRAFRSEIGDRRREFSSLAPLPAAASAGILQSLLGGAGSGASAGGGVAGVAAGKALGGSAAIKSAAAVLAVSAIGVVAADHRGALDLGLGGHDDAPVKSAPAPTRAFGRPAATARPHTAAGTAAPATSRPIQGGPDVHRASAVAPNGQRAAPEPSPAGLATEQAPQSNGRGLGKTKGSERAKSTDKPSHPEKGKKGGSPAAPGQSGSPGRAKHAAGEKGGGGAAAPAHPPHPEHPAHPQHPGAAAPGTEAEPPAGTEPGNGKHGE